MGRKLPELGEQVVADIEAAWAKPQEEWARKRLLVVRLIAQHELTVAQIMKVADVSRQTVFTYRDKVVEGGVAALLQREYAGGVRPTVRGAVAEELIERLEAGQFRQARDAQVWIKKRTRKTLSESGVRQLLRRLGGKLKVPRKAHTKKDPAKAAKFKLELPARLTEVAGAPAQPVRIWVLDEHRYGLLPVIRRVWARRGVRVHAPSATRYQWGYLHEALEVDGEHKTELLFTPAIDRIGDCHVIGHRLAVARVGGCQYGQIVQVRAIVRFCAAPPEIGQGHAVEGFGKLFNCAGAGRPGPAFHVTLDRLRDRPIMIDGDHHAVPVIFQLCHGTALRWFDQDAAAECGGGH